MRTSTRPLVVLALAASLAFGGEAADPATAQVPVAARAVFRLPSLERFDAIGAKLRPLLHIFSAEGTLPDFGKVKPSELWLEKLGLTVDLAVDRSRPVFLAYVEGDPVFLLTAAPETAWEGERELQGGRVAVLRGRTICIGKPVRLEAETRGRPTALIAGDAAVHVYLDEIIDAHRAAIDKWLAEMFASMKEELPQNLHGLADWMASVGNAALLGVEALDYALDLKEGRLISTGLLRTKPRSALKAYLAKMGAPRANDLVRLFPQGFFLAGDSATLPSWLYGDIAAALDRSFGEGSAAAFAGLLGPTALCGDSLTGRSAASISLIGMGGTKSLGASELKDAEKAKQALRSVDADAMRKRIEELGLPIAFQYEVSADQHGETELHRMNVRFKNMPMPMTILVTSQTYLAVEGNFLLSASGTSAAADLKRLIDRVRAKQRSQHPHQEAMERLDRERNFGFTFNLGAFKPFLVLLAMGDNELAPIMQALPGKLLLSTAVSMREEGLRWRGDWPLEEVGKIAKAVADFMKEKKLREELEKEFD